MMDVYVITCLGTPVAVSWSVMDAESFIDEWTAKDKANPRDNFRIFSASIEPMWQWIVTAMKRAAVVAAERGDKPVVVPVTSEAFLWAVSEVGEAADAYVSTLKDWVRNNPDKHVNNDFEKEVSQAIMMLALSIKSDFFGDIKDQLVKMGFVDDPYTEPLE